MTKVTLIKAWACKREIASIVGSAGLALFIIGEVESNKGGRENEKGGTKVTDSAAVQEASEMNQTRSAAFTASVTIEDKDGIAARNGVTIRADFIGMAGEVPTFADLIAARNGVKVASCRTPVGSSFELPVGSQRWCRITVVEINFLPPEVGESADKPNGNSQTEPPSKLNVILSIENHQEFP